MSVHKMIIGATIGLLVLLLAAVAVGHIILGDGTFSAAQRLFIAVALQLVVMLALMRMIDRPGEKKPLTWPAAMFGAVVVSGLSLLAFGSVPHEWITFADAELDWGRRDLIMFNLPDAIIPFDISRMAIRDIIAAGVYTQNFAAALAFWLLWQNRHQLAEEREKAAPETREPVPVGTSAYGRPLSKQA